MESKDVAFIFGGMFVGIMIMVGGALRWGIASDSYLIAIFCYAIGGLIVSFAPLIIDHMKRKQES